MPSNARSIVHELYRAPPLVRYAVAGVAVALACLARWSMPEVFGQTPYLAFYPAVVAAAALGGLGPGLLATLVCTFCLTWFFDATPGRIDLDDPAQLLRHAVFLASGAGISLLAWRLRRQSEALSQRERLYRGTFDNAAVGISHTDPEGRCLRANLKLGDMLGYAPGQLPGRTIGELTHPEDWESDKQLYHRMMRGELKQFSVEKRYLHKNGGDVWVHIHRSLQRDSAGRPDFSINIAEEITGRKAAEEQLRASRTSAQRAKEQAEEANCAKDRFLAVLSHELRTPLTPVLATVAMLAEDAGLGAEMRQAMEMIRRNVELEARLIDDLLDVTRIARGKVELQKRPVAVCEVLRRTAEVCMPDIEARQLHFGVKIDSPPHLIHADVGRLQQVFWNLIKNAVKFTPHGGCVGVRAWRQEDEVIVEVSDSGEGIAPEAMARIFQAFEQAERSTTRRFGGLGLGLTISKALVEMHGGSIEARSEGRGKGAIFTVRLPVLVEQQDDTAAADGGGRKAHEQPTAGQSAIGNPPSAMKPLRILLVEDHGDTARTLARLLMRQGHRVKTAGDVATALEAAEQGVNGDGRDGPAGEGGVDLLVSDLGLPDGSGVDVLRGLRERGHAMPAIALSGYGQEEDVRRSHEAGFAAHLTKPVTPERLFEAIATVARA